MSDISFWTEKTVRIFNVKQHEFVSTFKSFPFVVTLDMFISNILDIKPSYFSNVNQTGTMPMIKTVDNEYKIFFL